MDPGTRRPALPDPIGCEDPNGLKRETGSNPRPSAWKATRREDAEPKRLDRAVSVPRPSHICPDLPGWSSLWRWVLWATWTSAPACWGFAQEARGEEAARGPLTNSGDRVSVGAERERGQSVACTLTPWDRDVNPDAPSLAGPPHTHRHPPADRSGVRGGGAARRIVAHRGGRPGHPCQVYAPNARREATHSGGRPRPRGQTSEARWGRAGRREVTPLDEAIQDGFSP